MTPSLPVPRRALIALAGAASGLLLAGCASVFAPDRVVLGEAELAAAMARSFPVERKLLEVLDVQVDQPELRLRPEANRLAARFNLRALDRLFGRTLHGRIAFDTALRFEPADQTLRMNQVRVTDLRFDEAGVTASPNALAQRLGASLAERVLEDFVVYRLRPEQQERLARAGLKPGIVSIKSHGVEIALDRTAP